LENAWQVNRGGALILYRTEAVIREVAGHIDPNMTRHYSHPRIAARRAAVEALMTAKTGQFQGGYATNHVTKQLSASNGNS
jgi:hypothetical protein